MQTCGKIPWRRKWQPSSVFLPRESHGQWSLMGYSPQGHKESDWSEWAQEVMKHYSPKWWIWFGQVAIFKHISLSLLLHFDTLFSQHILFPWGKKKTWFCYLVGVSLCLWTSAVLIPVNFQLCIWGCFCALLSKSLALENNRGKLHYWYCQCEVQLVPKYIVIKSPNGWHLSRMLSFIKDWGRWCKLRRILGPR